MTPLIWHPAARQEFVERAEEFAQIDVRLAIRFNDRAAHCLRSIQENPLIYSARRHEIRRANLLPKFGEHYIAFVIWNRRVVILALGHAKRRPFYFHRRLEKARKLAGE